MALSTPGASTSFPAGQVRQQYGRQWGNYASANTLPNNPGNVLAAANFRLEAGDMAYVALSATTGLAYLCLSAGTAGGGDAVWSSVAVSASAMFFALMPGDNVATVGIGAAIQFPQDGPSVGGSAPTRVDASTFRINLAGTYSVSYQASVAEAGQLAVWVNGVAVAATRAGRATGGNQIGNTVLMTFATADAITVRNDASAGALTLTPIAGGAAAISATLTIVRVG